jgi:cation diffusion facilitator family transporter
VVIVWLSGSVALLADTVHNFGDTLNSVPLLIAFYLARRPATPRYSYGFGRAEDVAGIVIVLSILFSAGYIFWESAQKLINPQPIEQLPWVAAASIIGLLGNEAVAYVQLRTGRRIGSEALIADGLHARIDGLTSLAVLIAVAGAALGWTIVDPIIGLLIAITILFIARDATKRIWYRLMDAVEPGIIHQIEHGAAEVEGVDHVATARARWVGHQLLADLKIIADESATDTSHVAHDVRQSLLRHVPHLSDVTIEVTRPEPDNGEHGR